MLDYAVTLDYANCNVGINFSKLSNNPCICPRKRYNSHIYYYEGGKALSFWNELSSASHLR
jgi:hypothetical protein